MSEELKKPVEEVKKPVVIEEVKEPEVVCPKCPNCGGDTAHIIIDENYAQFICNKCLTRI